MKVINLQTALKHLSRLDAEIRHQRCFEEKQFSSGLIAFRFHRNADSKQINHNDKDVICHVLKGRGRLRINERRIQLRPGMICHIPKRTPHDFAAGKSGELILFYSLIKTS